MNARKCIAGGLAAALTLTAAATQAVTIEEFESYGVGDVQTVASPPWTAEQPTATQIVSDGSNQYITYEDTVGDWLHSYRPTGVPVNLTGQLIFDIYIEDDVEIDHAFGLVGALDGASIDWYADYGPYVRVTTDSGNVSGVASLDTRDGGGFVDDIAALNTQQWYEITLDVDTSGGGTFDVYVDGGLVYSDSGFRRTYGAPLDTFLLFAGTGTSPLVRVDNVRIVIPEPTSVVLAASMLGVGLLRRRK